MTQDPRQGRRQGRWVWPEVSGRNTSRLQTHVVWSTQVFGSWGAGGLLAHGEDWEISPKTRHVRVFWKESVAALGSGLRREGVSGRVWQAHPLVLTPPCGFDSGLVPDHSTQAGSLRPPLLRVV